MSVPESDSFPRPSRIKGQELKDLRILIRGAGEMASGIAWRLRKSGWREIIMTEIPRPLAVRRTVSFCEALFDSVQTIEGVSARKANSLFEAFQLNQAGQIAVAADPECRIRSHFSPHILIDAIMGKRNLGTNKDQAELVIAMGPGFFAGLDAHYVIETNRGHDLGRLITQGSAAADTGVPGEILGRSSTRVLRSPADGVLISDRRIGDIVNSGDIIAQVNGHDLKTEISGALRGLIRPGTHAHKGLKVGDVDPRANTSYCGTISEKARALGGSVLEAILRTYNN